MAQLGLWGLQKIYVQILNHSYLTRLRPPAKGYIAVSRVEREHDGNSHTHGRKLDNCKKSSMWIPSKGAGCQESCLKRMCSQGLRVHGVVLQDLPGIEKIGGTRIEQWRFQLDWGRSAVKGLASNEVTAQRCSLNHPSFTQKLTWHHCVVLILILRAFHAPNRNRKHTRGKDWTYSRYW